MTSIEVDSSLVPAEVAAAAEDTAQRLAASASDEARLATDQLAAQSEYLKALLDTLSHRDAPQAIADGTAEAGRRASGRPQDRDAG